MFDDFFDCMEWMLPDRTLNERWDLRKFKKYPSPDASEEEIMEFIYDALQAERKIEYEMVSAGVSKEEAIREACQYPLKSDAPMDVIRKWISYENWVHSNKDTGIDP